MDTALTGSQSGPGRKITGHPFAKKLTYTHGASACIEQARNLMAVID
ncbi:MAG: hypothetical protein K0U93_16965 [Gammaproteobacteria bacterium]|nr:hypothetical protein [Gammaproteobacteria bacterium]